MNATKNLCPLLLLLTLFIHSLHGSIEEKNLDLIQQSVKQVDFDNPILIDMPRGEKNNLMVNMIRSSLKAALADTDKLEVVTLYTKMIAATTSQEAAKLHLDMLPVIEQTALAISEELKDWPALLKQQEEIDWVEIIAKITDSVIEGCLRPALSAKTDMSLLSQSIAFGTAAPFMQARDTPYSTLIKVAKGINYGIPYKFIDSILSSAPPAKQPEIIEKISRNTAYGTISAAIASGIEYEEIVHAATDAFSSSVITIASQKKIPLDNIATLTRYASQGIMTGTVNATTDTDLPFNELGAVLITKIEGEVKVERASTQQRLAKDEIKQGTTIYQDHNIITGENGRVTLLFSNGTITDLEPNSLLAIKKFTQQPFDVEVDKLSELKNEPSTSQTDLDLRYGNLVFNVKKLNRGSYMNIKSPLGNASIKGTTGRIRVIILQNGRASGGVSLATGAVDFSRGNTFSPSNGSSGVTLNNGESSSGNETVSIVPGQNIEIKDVNTNNPSSPVTITANNLNPNDAKDISQTTLTQTKEAGESAMNQISQVLIVVRNVASQEVTQRVSSASRVVAAGIGGAGIGAIRASGLNDPNNMITGATAEGIATGSVLAAKNSNLDFVDVAFNVSMGTVQGAAVKTIEFEADVEAAMDAIGNGHGLAISTLSEMQGLFTRNQILAIGDALNKGRGEGLEFAVTQFPIFDPFIADENKRKVMVIVDPVLTDVRGGNGNSSTNANTTGSGATVIIVDLPVTGGGGGGFVSPVN